MAKKAKDKDRLPIFDKLSIAVLVIFGFIVILLPESGEKVMVTNTARIVFILLSLLYAIIWIIRCNSFFNTRLKKVCQIALIVCLIGAGALCCFEHSLDVSGGTETVTLYQAEVYSRRNGGRYSSRTKYYVKGKDGMGEERSFQISYADYEKLSEEKTIVVEYYVSTETVLRAEAFPKYEFVPPNIDWGIEINP